MDINRLMTFPMRRLSESEKKWLKAKIKDERPEVADTAQEIYNVCFPYAERNAMKKQLIINTLSFEIHTEVYDEYGDMEMTDRLFTIDRKSRVLTMMDFHADSSEQSIVLDGGKMAKLLRYIVHTLEIFTAPRETGGLLCSEAVVISFDDTRYCTKRSIVSCYLVYIFLNATDPPQKKNLYHKRKGMEELTLWNMDMCACPVWIRTRTGR